MTLLMDYYCAVKRRPRVAVATLAILTLSSFTQGIRLLQYTARHVVAHTVAYCLVASLLLLLVWALAAQFIGRKNHTGVPWAIYYCFSVLAILLFSGCNLYFASQTIFGR